MRILAASAALVLLLGGCAGSNEYLLGEDLYVRSCAVCHGLDGDGGGDHHAGDWIEQLAGVITVGPGNMPGFSRLTPEQVASLVSYVRSLAN